LRLHFPREVMISTLFNAVNADIITCGIVVAEHSMGKLYLAT